MDYITVSVCKSSGQHGQSVDSDGYCNSCGHQDYSDGEFEDTIPDTETITAHVDSAGSVTAEYPTGERRRYRNRRTATRYFSAWHSKRANEYHAQFPAQGINDWPLRDYTTTYDWRVL